ncbi:uncharacterized protein TNCV_1677311 [Trichonephila clavipes]|nr:uncharacterized protein TNCV_1677311 [Trichonephila clavipes]
MGDQSGPEEEDTRNADPTIKIKDTSSSPQATVIRSLGEEDQAVRIEEEKEEPNSNNAKKWEENTPAEGRRRWKFWSEVSATRNINQELRFQQDGATCHTARATIDLWKDTFGDHLISRFGPVNWPPRSCDLTLLDYFLWGYVKSVVYADKPQTLDHLEDNIRRVICRYTATKHGKVIENWMSSLDYIRASLGIYARNNI